jgi:hypothetical protein
MTPRQNAGGLPKMHLAEVPTGIERTEVAGNIWSSFCFECILMNFTIPYGKNILDQLSNCKCIKGKTAA